MQSQPYRVRTPFLLALSVTAMILMAWSATTLGASLSVVTWP